MVHHVVLFKIKDGIAEESVAAMADGIAGLKQAIPGVLTVSCGRNFTERGKGYNFGLVVQLASRAALEAYGPHPAHRQVVETLIQPIIDDILAVDYES